MARLVFIRRSYRLARDGYGSLIQITLVSTIFEYSRRFGTKLRLLEKFRCVCFDRSSLSPYSPIFFF